MDVKYKIDSLMIFDSIQLEEEPGAPAQAVEWAEGALSLLPSFDLEFSLPQKRWAPARRETDSTTIPACARRSALCYHLKLCTGPTPSVRVGGLATPQCPVFSACARHVSLCHHLNRIAPRALTELKGKTDIFNFRNKGGSGAHAYVQRRV